MKLKIKEDSDIDRRVEMPTPGFKRWKVLVAKVAAADSDETPSELSALLDDVLEASGTIAWVVNNYGLQPAPSGKKLPEREHIRRHFHSVDDLVFDCIWPVEDFDLPSAD